MAGTQDGEPKIKNGHNCALDIYTLQEPILHEKENEKSREKHWSSRLSLDLRLLRGEKGRIAGCSHHYSLFSSYQRNLIPGRSTFEAKTLNAKCYLSVSQGKRFIELAICQQINFLCTTEIFARYRQILSDFASNSTHLSLLAEA